MKKSIFLLILLCFSMFSFSENNRRINNPNNTSNTQVDRRKKVIKDLKDKRDKDQQEKLEKSVIKFKSKTKDWDYFATTISSHLDDGLKKVKTIGISLLSILFAIQLVFDFFTLYANFRLDQFVSSLFKRLLTFCLYIFIINKIVDGTIFKMVEEMAYTLVQLLAQKPGVEKLSNIWAAKDKFIGILWEIISSLWSFWSIVPMEFQKDLITSLFFLSLILYINISFFMMMVNLFKALISFKLVLGLSVIFLPLGITDGTKEYYSIGRVISLCINFIVKLVSINFIAIVTMTVLSNQPMFKNVNSIFDFWKGNGPAVLVLIGVVMHLLRKVDVNF